MNMQVKTVKVSEKGQIAIPLDIREAIGIKKGDELIVMQDGNKIFVEKATESAETLKARFEPLLRALEKLQKS